MTEMSGVSQINGAAGISGASKVRGRFDVPVRSGTFVKLFLAGLWDAIRLRCPSCSKGRIFASGAKVNPHCSVCGAPFERPGEGDFVGAVLVAYTITALVFFAVFLLLGKFTAMSLETRLWLSLPLVGSFVALFYRQMKGVWIAILVPVAKWLG